MVCNVSRWGWNWIASVRMGADKGLHLWLCFMWPQLLQASRSECPWQQWEKKNTGQLSGSWASWAFGFANCCWCEACKQWTLDWTIPKRVMKTEHTWETTAMYTLRIWSCKEDLSGVCLWIKNKVASLFFCWALSRKKCRWTVILPRFSLYPLPILPEELEAIWNPSACECSVD